MKFSQKMSGSLYIIPDIRTLARRVGEVRPNAPWQELYNVVFEFIRFFRLKQKLSDFDPATAVLAPSAAVDQVWHLFIQDTKAYLQACGSADRFIHHDPTGANDASYERRLKRTREEYVKEYREQPPVEFWGQPEGNVLAPASPPPAPTKKPRGARIGSSPHTARMSTGPAVVPRPLSIPGMWNILFKGNNGETYKTSVYHTAPVTELIVALRKQSGNFEGQIVLSIGNHRLDESLWLPSYKDFFQFNEDSELVVDYTINAPNSRKRPLILEDTWNILFKGMNGKTYKIHISNGATIKELIEALHIESGIPEDQIVLSIGGQRLDKEMWLSSYADLINPNEDREFVINFMINLRGC
jgi:hypothetical protein